MDYTTSVAALLDEWTRLRVLVVGDAMLDSYMHGAAGRLCREAPVPVVTLGRRVDNPGGAANTAANVRALGAAVALLGVVGDDEAGARLRDALQIGDVDDRALLTQTGRATLAKHRLFADAQMLVRFDQGSTEPVAPHVEDALLDRLDDLFFASDAVIISDYGYGVLSPRVIERLAALQRVAPRVLVADAKQLPAYRHVGLSAVKPNYGEGLNLLGIAEPPGGTARAEALAPYGARLLERTGAQLVAWTLDSDGALLFEAGQEPYRTYAPPTPQARPAGAGDTYISALALALAAGAATSLAAEIAAQAAGVVVSSDGTAVCSLAELRVRLLGEAIHYDDLPSLSARLAQHRSQGRRIVFTNGCFDILHSGHIAYLNRARALGDVLVVGVNSDAGVRRIKGPGRPINTLADRVQVLGALSCVDHLVAFDEDTPHALIRAIRPDVFVKGGTYTRDRLPEAELVEALGGRVQILPTSSDRSTSALLARIRELAVAEPLVRQLGLQ
jgi:D-beta-D-heptose 7-phosphate kinase / D-beta-D-heptose 1-phosphate adenosyltransferase